MATGDVYQIDLVQRYGSAGEPMRNTFHYIGTGVTVNAEDVATAFQGTGGPLERLNDLQCNFIKNDTLRVINLFSLTDFFDVNLSGTGDNVGDPEPPFVAVNLTLKLNTRGIRPGSKRFAGLPEGAITNGVIVASGTITDLNELATALAAPLPYTLDEVANPIVVKRILVPADPPDHAAYYRLPTDSGELDYGEVVAVLVNLRASHQVSRGNSR